MTIKQKIQSLLTLANATTGESDTNLTDAVQALVDGFGSGDSTSAGTFTFVNACANAANVRDAILPLVPNTFNFLILRTVDPTITTNNHFHQAFIWKKDATAPLAQNQLFGAWSRYHSGDLDTKTSWTTTYDAIIRAGEQFDVWVI